MPIDPDELEDDLPLTDELDASPGEDLDDDLPPEDDLDQPLAGEDDEQPAGRQPGRRERAVLKAKAEARDLKRQLADRDRELASARSSQNGQSQAERERQEREAYALMSPDERADFDRKRSDQRIDNLDQRARFLYSDLADQRKFDRKCGADPRYMRLADDVEDRLAEYRKTGGNPTREEVFKIVFAERLLAKAPKAAARQRQAGADRVRSQRVAAPGGGRSAEPARGGGRLSEREARRKRLEGVTF